jgi:DNA polymerase (family 10)
MTWRDAGAITEMNNYAVARVFTRIADLMEIKGENIYKIRAYRNAAQTMQELTESLEVLAERGELRTIPNVGDAIADKTRDILATGTTKLYEQLKAELPVSLLELMGLPGFGPKKIQTVYRELGVRTLDDLERAVHDGQLRTVSGFSAKSEENLRQAIEGFRRRRERVPIFEALPYAEALVRMLGDSGHFSRVEIAGSVRRMKDLVGDIDLLGETADPAAALEAWASHPEVKDVLHQDERSVSACTHTGMQVDVHTASPARFGARWQHLTGSASHNRQLEARAAERGVPLAADAALDVEGADEGAVYERVGLPPIPAELREGAGEVEAAREGRLPKLIEVMDLKGILHAHSTWTDGSHSIAQMAAAARKLGYAYHGNTDHSKSLFMVGGLDEEKLRAQMAEIDALNATFDDSFRVLKGIECDILADGALDLPLDLLNELDIVIASVHAHQRQDEETITRRVIRALESGVVDLLAHPTGRILGHRDPSAIDMERVMDAALANRVALEINAYPDRLDLNEVYARRAKERGIPISLNTDAHRPEHLSMLRYGIAQARRSWLEPADVINCWPVDRLMRWLHGRA